MTVCESALLCFPGLLFIYRESCKTELSAGAIVIFNRFVVYDSAIPVNAYVRVLDSQEVPVHEVIHEKPEFSLCAR